MKITEMEKLLLPSSSFLKGKMYDSSIVHVVVSQRVGIFDENTLKKSNNKKLVVKVGNYI